MPMILVIYHSQSGNTRAAARLVAEGARSVRGAKVKIKKALNATTEDLLACDGLAVGTPDYFSYMAGGVKDFFDRTFYPTKGQVTDKPCAIFVTHGGGGRAVDSLERMCQTFNFKKVDESVLVQGSPGPEEREALKGLGEALARAAAT